MSRIEQCIWGLVFSLLVTTSVCAKSTGQPQTESKPSVTEVAAPTWLAAVTLPELPAKQEKPIHYRLYNAQVNAEHGQAAYYQYRYVFTDASGIQDNSAIRIRFNPAYEQLQFHHMQIWRDGQLARSVPISEVQLLNAEDEQGDNLYSGEYDALVLLKDIRLGDELDYSYSVLGANPVFSGKFGYFAKLGWGIAVDKVHFSVLANSQRPIQYQALQGVKIAVKQEAVAEGSEQLKRYRVDLLNTKPVIADSDTPSWYSPYPYLQFSEWSDWPELQQWAQQLFQQNQVKSNELTAFIAKLQALPQAQAIDRAINFVQNDIRYLGLELGVNSHLPNSPDQVFANRYGDCKDKALLLATLLQQLGVEASPALVSSSERYAVADLLPSHQAFNHAITSLVWQGQRYWVDPTVNYQGRSLANLYQSNFGKALLIDTQHPQLIDATPLSQHSAISITEQILAADYVSPVLWQVTTVMNGIEAENFRYRLASQGRDKVANAYLNYYAKHYPAITATQDLQIQDDEQANQLVVVEHYSVPDYWQINDEGSAEFTLTADYGHQYTQLPKSIRRTAPLAMTHPVDVTHQVSLRMPEDIDFTEAQYQKSWDTAYFRYDSQLRYDRKTITLTNHYQSRQWQVPVKDVAKHISTLKKVDDYAGYSGSITNVSQDPNHTALQAIMTQIADKVAGDE